MFKILSLDGGGARGSFIVGVLSELEKQTNSHITDYFDLIAGTSSGGVIGILISLGYPMSVIEEIYANKFEIIFRKNSRYFSGIYRLINLVTDPFVDLFMNIKTEELIKAKYASSGVIEVLYDLVKNKYLSDIHHSRLLITATNLKDGSPKLFKTFHLPDRPKIEDAPVGRILASTAAAPTFFEPVKIRNLGTFADGGLWANNPGLAAYAEAVEIITQCHRSVDPPFQRNFINMLSIGTGSAIQNFTPPMNNSGIKWWATKLLPLMFESQSKSTCFYLEKLMLNRFLRLDFEIPNKSWGKLDNYAYSKEMIALGKITMQKNLDKVLRMFGEKKTGPFVPFDPV